MTGVEERGPAQSFGAIASSSKATGFDRAGEQTPRVGPLTSRVLLTETAAQRDQTAGHQDEPGDPGAPTFPAAAAARSCGGLDLREHELVTALEEVWDNAWAAVE
jgi:hypothetical protein